MHERKGWECIQQVSLPRKKKGICEQARAVIQEETELLTLPVVPCYEQVYLVKSSPSEDVDHDIRVEGPLVVVEGPAEMISQFILRARKVRCLQMYQVGNAEVPQLEGLLAQGRGASITACLYTP